MNDGKYLLSTFLVYVSWRFKDVANYNKDKPPKKCNILPSI